MYTCVYIYIYIYTHIWCMYAYIYIYVHQHGGVWCLRVGEVRGERQEMDAAEGAPDLASSSLVYISVHDSRVCYIIWEYTILYYNILYYTILYSAIELSALATDQTVHAQVHIAGGSAFRHADTLTAGSRVLSTRRLCVYIYIYI